MVDIESKDKFLFSVSSDCHYIALGVKAILSLEALGLSPEEYQVRFYEKNASMLSALIKPHDERLIHDLRVISFPDRKIPTRGRISAAMITRLKGGPAEEAVHIRQHLLNLFRATYNEYEIAPMKTPEIQKMLRPFQVSFIAELRRRCDRVTLESVDGYSLLHEVGLEKRKPPAPSVKIEGHAPLNTAIHLYPFVRTLGDASVLSRLLLSEAQPYAISFRIQPTKSNWADENIFESQAGACENTLQKDGLHPTLRIQAQTIARFHTERLFGLRNSAALSIIEIASPAAIPTTVIDTVGSLITESTGERFTAKEAGPARFFAGGYKVLIKTGEETCRCFCDLDIVPPRESLVKNKAWRTPFLFDSNEAAAFFHFPPAGKNTIWGVDIKSWKSISPPPNLPEKGCRLGSSSVQGSTQTVWISPEDRQRHIYIVGQTGTGKTTLLKTMILEDMRRGEGLCVIDPHGDLYAELITKVPESRKNDVVLFDPTDAEYPVALNMLEARSKSESYFLAQEFAGIIRRLMFDDYGYAGMEMIGPLFFQHMRMNLLLAMSNPDDPGTLLEFYNIFQSYTYWKRWIPLKSEDPILKQWVTSVLPATNYIKSISEGGSMGGYVASKFESFIFEPRLRNIFGQKRALINYRKIMDDGNILLVNLAKGELTEENSRLLGMILMAKIMAAAMSRVALPAAKRRPFHLYVDEFQSIATSSFVTLASEARKFGLSLILANQFLTQIRDESILKALFGNVGSIISFRLGQEDAQLMEKKFAPSINQSDLINLPNWIAFVSTTVKGQAVRPFSFRTVLDRTKENEDNKAELLFKTRGKYARPRAEVENEIMTSVTTTKSDEDGEILGINIDSILKKKRD